MTQIFDWIITHFRAMIVAGILLAVAIGIYGFVSANALIVVTPTGNAKGQTITTSISTDSETREVGKTGMMIIPRNTKSLIITGDNHRKTQISLTIPWHGYLETKVDFVLDKNADKVAFNSIFSSTCVTYSPRLQSLLSYRCGSPAVLMQYQTPESGSWRNIPVASSLYYQNNTVKPYYGGLLGIAPTQADSPEATTSPLVFTDDKGKRIFYTLPEGLGNDSLDQAAVFTNQRDPRDPRFILTTINGAVYLGTPSEKEGIVDYKAFTTPITDYTKTSHQTICRIAGDDVYCYQGSAPVGDATPELKSNDVISHYSFKKGFIEKTPVQDSTFLENLYVTESGEIYGKQSKKLLRFTKDNGQYHTTEIAQNIDSGSAGDKMYYIQDGDLYQVTSASTANLLFHSGNIVGKTVFVTDGRVYLLGTINNSNDTSLQAYVINNEDNTSPSKRIIDLLPTASNEIPYAVSQKLVGKILQIGLIVTVAKIPGDTNTPVSEIDERKQAVINSLTNHNIDMNAITVRFTY